MTVPFQSLDALYAPCVYAWGGEGVGVVQFVKRIQSLPAIVYLGFCFHLYLLIFPDSDEMESRPISFIQRKLSVSASSKAGLTPFRPGHTHRVRCVGGDKRFMSVPNVYGFLILISIPCTLRAIKLMLKTKRDWLKKEQGC